MKKPAELKTIGYRIPDSDVPCKYFLRASLSDGTTKCANEWEVYAFPCGGETSRKDIRSWGGAVSAPQTEVKVVSDISEQDLQTAMAKGERVLLLGAGPFKALPTTFRIGMAGRCSGNLATVIKAGHPVFGDFPHEGYCGWPFRCLMEGGRAVQLEADVPFDPIVDVASSVKTVIRQAALFEYRVGEGGGSSSVRSTFRGAIRRRPGSSTAFGTMRPQTPLRLRRA